MEAASEQRPDVDGVRPLLLGARLLLRLVRLLGRGDLCLSHGMPLPPVAAMPRKRSQSELPGAADLYDRLLAAQGGTCALCSARGKTRRMHLDHDHKTNRTRGVLCFRCNNALPAWVTPQWLRDAADYLEGRRVSPVEREAYPSMVQVQREAARGVREAVPAKKGPGSS